jgi:hypothetical protein
MSTKSTIAIIAALATIIAVPAYAANQAKHQRPAFTGAYASPVNPGHTQGYDFQRDGRLPLAGPFTAQ